MVRWFESSVSSQSAKHYVPTLALATLLLLATSSGLSNSSKSSTKHWHKAGRLAAEQGSAACPYGVLPGRWIGDRWQPFDGKCQLEDLTQLAIVPLQGPPAVASRRVLLIGDSVDRMAVEQFCPHDKRYLTHPSDEEAPPFRCLYCITNEMSIANYPFWGVFRQGPYFENRTQPPSVRIPRALELFQKVMHSAPELVILTSNYWDVAAMRVREPEALESSYEIPQHFMEQWFEDAAAAMQMVEEAVPHSTLLAWQTRHYPLMGSNRTTGQHKVPKLGRHSHVAQLNAAGRQLCLQHPRWQLVDVELVAARFSDERQYLRRGDAIHPNGLLANATTNIYYSLVGQARRAAKTS